MRRILGVFNIHRITFPNLYASVKPLQEILKKKMLSECDKLQQLVRTMWVHVLKNNLELDLVDKVDVFHMRVY